MNDSDRLQHDVFALTETRERLLRENDELRECVAELETQVTVAERNCDNLATGYEGWMKRFDARKEKLHRRIAELESQQVHYVEVTGDCSYKLNCVFVAVTESGSIHWCDTERLVKIGRPAGTVRLYRVDNLPQVPVPPRTEANTVPMEKPVAVQPKSSCKCEDIIWPEPHPYPAEKPVDDGFWWTWNGSVWQLTEWFAGHWAHDEDTASPVVLAYCAIQKPPAYVPPQKSVVEQAIDVLVTGVDGVCWTDRVSAAKLVNKLDAAGLLRKED